MDIIIKQEKMLHQYDIRQNLTKVSKLLHPTFHEVGRSGTSYDVECMIESMKLEQPSDGYLHSQEFECTPLAESVYLLLYKSAWVEGDRRISGFAKRSSIWILNGDNWQMKYHQGTPCAVFELIEQQ